MSSRSPESRRHGCRREAHTDVLAGVSGERDDNATVGTANPFQSRFGSSTHRREAHMDVLAGVSGERDDDVTEGTASLTEAG